VTAKTLPQLTCPSDLVAPRTLRNGITHHNYLVNYGNTVYDQMDFSGIRFGGAPFAEKAGWADPHEGFKFNDILDGTSNTLMMAEAIQPAAGSPGDLRAYSWWRGGATFQGFLGPNSSSPDIMFNAAYCDPPPQFPLNPPCLKIAGSRPSSPVMQAARSRHRGGVNVNFCDGSGRFISNNIALNVWRALASSKGGEAMPQGAF
jgi:prepilin-type processing-associated H-X9-DG protein